ncbi:uncharacterized protein LOC143904740 isoform X1 [Temnothorax americanus]|uniref:uncharacterized protein LOC143904740 isoform X1 n=2 Tax=Temnothorax americanus TaxID=1964332 RepID=UPI0040679027
MQAKLCTILQDVYIVSYQRCMHVCQEAQEQCYNSIQRTVKDCHLKLVRLMGLSVFLRLWLCYASKTLYNPTRRLYLFLSTLYACLSRSARAVLQFYPENGQGLPFKAGTFDGAVSISALVVVLCKQNFAQSYKTFISFLINVVCMSVKKRKSSVTILSRERSRIAI